MGGCGSQHRGPRTPGAERGSTRLAPSRLVRRWPWRKLLRSLGQRYRYGASQNPRRRAGWCANVERGGPAPCREALVLAKPRGLPLAAADGIAKNPLESIVRRTWAVCLRDHTARLGRVQSPFGGGKKIEVCG
ncbi:unnamed protein product [Ixodes pacificus]